MILGELQKYLQIKSSLHVFLWLIYIIKSILFIYYVSVGWLSTHVFYSGSLLPRDKYVLVAIGMLNQNNETALHVFLPSFPGEYHVQGTMGTIVLPIQHSQLKKLNKSENSGTKYHQLLRWNHVSKEFWARCC